MKILGAKTFLINGKIYAVITIT